MNTAQNISGRDNKKKQKGVQKWDTEQNKEQVKVRECQVVEEETEILVVVKLEAQDTEKVEVEEKVKIEKDNVKTALVTGGTGFIGHYLANELDSRGYKVTVIDFAYNFCKELNKNINFILKDIRTGGLSGEYDFVFHLAAKRSVPLSFKYPQDYMSTNIWGTWNLMQTYPNSRFINISSSNATSTKSIYGVSKRATELLAPMHNNSVNVRLFNIFGERQIDEFMAIPCFMHALKYKHPITIDGDGKQLRDYTYVLDVVNEIIKIGEDSKKGLVEPGYGTPITINNLYKELCELAKMKSTTTHGPIRRGDVRKTCARHIIQEPLYGFSQGLRRTVRWYLKSRIF